MSILNMFKKKKENIPEMLIETNSKLMNKNSYFSNYNQYENSPEFIKEFIKIITDKEEYEVNENSEFEDAIKYLINNNYLVSCNNDEIIDTLNSNFNENIDKDLVLKKLEEYEISNNKYMEAIKKNIIEMAVCEQLEKNEKGLIYIYSAGDYYCYGIETQEKIDKIRKIFE